MPAGLTYGSPGSGTYSVTLAGLDEIMSTIPDNTINQVTTRNFRDVVFTMYEIVQLALSPNFSSVTSIGNTTSLPILIGGLQVNGTSSFYKNVNLISTISDISGSTGSSNYILSATNGGVSWIPYITSVTPSLQQVTNVGNVTNKTLELGGLQVDGQSVFIGPINAQSMLLDSFGSHGTAGYILSQTNSNLLMWVPNTGSGNSTSGLQQITTNGNTTSNTMVFINRQFSGSNSTTNIIIDPNNSAISIFNGATNSSTPYVASLNFDKLSFTKGLGFTASISIPSITQNSTFSIPNISGTAALISNVTLDQAIFGGYTSSRYIQIGGIQISGTSSFASTQITNLRVTSTASFSSTVYDSLGLSGAPGYILTATNSGVEWMPNTSYVGINAQSAGYSIVTSDNQKLITISSSSTSYITIPTNASQSFPVGTTIQVARLGSGAVTFTNSTAVSILSQSNYRSISLQYLVASIIQISTNNWLLIGNLTI